MRQIIRYQSQLLYRQSYKPSRLNRIRLAAGKQEPEFRRPRAGPNLKTYECKTN